MGALGHLPRKCRIVTLTIESPLMMPGLGIVVGRCRDIGVHLLLSPFCDVSLSQSQDYPFPDQHTRFNG